MRADFLLPSTRKVVGPSIPDLLHGGEAAREFDCCGVRISVVRRLLKGRSSSPNFSCVCKVIESTGIVVDLSSLVLILFTESF